jgi:hypothetical protein
MPGDARRGLCGTSVLQLPIFVVSLEESLYNVTCRVMKWSDIMVFYCLILGRIKGTPERGVSQMSEDPETTQTTKSLSTNGMPQPPFILRTPLAKRLWELRQEIIASGVPLLSLDEVRKEVQERRGGVVEEES